MNKYYIFTGANREKPGSGLIVQEYEAEDDTTAVNMAHRHYEDSGYTVWAHDGVNHLEHIQFRFVGQLSQRRKA